MDSPAPFMPVPNPVARSISAEREAELRRAIVSEALSWNRTPYVPMGDIKGKAVDCAMLLVRCWVDSGIFQPFDPRPYPSNWNMHHDDERYLRWMQALSVEVPIPGVGDVALYHFGRCLSHGGIVVAPGQLCNATAIHGRCTVNDMSEAWLTSMNGRGRNSQPRPVKFFDLFARLRDAA